MLNRFDQGEVGALKNCVMCDFTRTLHPVGDGAFFTEQFWEQNSNWKLNVVYDCGSGNRSSSRIINRELESTFTINDHIDMVFISHFDNDHINGFLHLMNVAVIDCNTLIFVPFKYPYLLMAMDSGYPVLSKFVAQAHAHGAHFIGVDYDERLWGEEAFYGESRRTGDLLEGNTGNSMLLGNNAISIVSPNMNHNRPIWYYKPFMHNQDLAENARDFYIRIQDIFGDHNGNITINLNSYNDIVNNLSRLKEIYEYIGHTVNGVTRINVNSLMVLSFTAEKRADTISPHQITGFNVCDKQNTICSFQASCLYTGDTVLISNNHYDYFEEVLKFSCRVLNHYSHISDISMIQIPHHGSERCFNSVVAFDNRMKSAFLNRVTYPITNTPKHIKIIERDFIKANKPLFLVSKSPFIYKYNI